MPMARIESRVVVGSDPTLMPDGAAAAILMALNRSGLTLEEMGVIEINETFAALVLAEARKLGADMSRVNPNGGAIAHGDPLGASGAILMTKLVNELERQRVRFGLQSMTTVQGMSIATIIESVDALEGFTFELSTFCPFNFHKVVNVRYSYQNIVQKCLLKIQIPTEDVLQLTKLTI